jgi:hypothetical protein
VSDHSLALQAVIRPRAPIPCTPRKSGSSFRRRSRQAKIECGSANVAQIRRCVANRTLVRLCCSLCVLYTKGTTPPDEFTARIWRVPATRCSARAGRKARSESVRAFGGRDRRCKKAGQSHGLGRGRTDSRGGVQMCNPRQSILSLSIGCAIARPLQVAIPDAARRLLRSGGTSHLALEELHWPFADQASVK